MAEVATNTQVVLKVTDAEWRLLMKSLAFFVGLKVTNKPDDRERAALLNKQLLAQRVAVYKDALKGAENAQARAEAGFGVQDEN